MMNLKKKAFFRGCAKLAVKLKSLPPGGRGTEIAVEGALVTLNLCNFDCNAFSLSLLLRKIQLPPGGSLS